MGTVCNKQWWYLEKCMFFKYKYDVKCDLFLALYYFMHIFLLAIIIVFTFSRLYSNSEYICNYDAYNCGDFKTHLQAQTAYEECGGVANDIHALDRDKDGLACESLP